MFRLGHCTSNTLLDGGSTVPKPACFPLLSLFLTLLLVLLSCPLHTAHSLYLSAPVASISSSCYVLFASPCSFYVIISSPLLSHVRMHTLCSPDSATIHSTHSTPLTCQYPCSHVSLLATRRQQSVSYPSSEFSSSGVT